jgi:hypothetical protein
MFSSRASPGAMAEHVQDIEFILSVPFSLSILVLNVFFFPVANRDHPTEVEGDNKPSSSAGAGSCLVRIPIDELQASKSNT